MGLPIDRNGSYLTINLHFYRRIEQSYCIKLDIYKSHCFAVYANKNLGLSCKHVIRGFCLLKRFINISDSYAIATYSSLKNIDL